MRKRIHIVCIFVILTVTTASADKKTLNITNDRAFINPALNISYLIDSNNEKSIEDITSPVLQHNFFDNITDIPQSKLSPFTLWIKFKVKSDLDESPYLEIGNQEIDSIEYYLFNKNQELVHHKSTGSYASLQPRVIENNRLTISMNLYGNEEYTCYIKIISKSSMAEVPVRIASLKTFYTSRQSDTLWQGLYFGLMVFLLIYNVFLFFTLKEPSYLYFALFIACSGLLIGLQNGFGLHYNWDQTTYLNQFATILSALAGIFIILFTSSFLNSKIKFPILHIWLMANIGLFLITILLNISGKAFISAKLLSYNSIAVFFFVMLAAIKSWKNGYNPAKFFLLAWSLFAVGFIIHMLIEANILSLNEVAGSIFQISSAVSVLLMSFAMAKRINIYIDKSNAAQELVMRTEIDNEYLVSNQNQLLEARVNQKTRDLEQTIATLSRQRKDLHEANEFKNKVFSIISHDLKSPISTLVSLLKLMKIQSLNETEKDKVIESLDLTLKSTKNLLDNILAWAFKENNNKQDVDEIEVYALVEEAFQLFKYQANLKGINLANSVEKEFHIMANRDMLQLVLRNLISNAIKFTRKNGTVEICMVQDYLDLSLLVKDDGVGMKEEVMLRLFNANKHVSTRGTDNEKGTGLGLMLCKEFVDKYNGSLEVESKVGEGSTFTIKLKNAIPILETVFA